MANPYASIAFTEAWYNTSQSRDFIQRNESRGSVYGILDAAILDGQNKLFTNKQIEALRTASERPVKIPILQKEAVGSGTARKCTGTGDGGSATVTPTWATIIEEFSISADELLRTSIISPVEIMQHRINQKLLSMHNRLDSAGNT